MKASANLLWIKSRMPGLVADGSSMVSQGLISSIPAKYAIDLMCSRITGREESFAAASPGRFRRIEVTQPDNSGSLLQRLAYRIGYTTRSHLSRTPRSVFYQTGRRTRRGLALMLEQQNYDRVIAEYYGLARLLAPVADRATLVLHDADHISLDIQAEKESSLPNRLGLRYRAAQMRAYLARELGAIDRLVTLSSYDCAAFEALGLHNVRSIAVPMPPLPASAPDLTGTAIVFLGSVDYLPNRDGLEWFVADVLPLVRRSMPSVRLKVIGTARGPAAARLARSEGVEFTGWVSTAEMDRHLAESALTVAPIRLGTGVKTKVLELMWKGLPVVSTTIASRGTPAENGGAIIADTPDAFASATVELLSSLERRIRCRDAAWDLLRRDHVSEESHRRTFETLMG